MKNTSIPNDPAMLVSYINLKLRDYYSSLEELCRDMELDKEELTSLLETIDYEYDEKQNRFR